VKSLNNNELNYAATSYHLLMNQHAFSLKGNFIESGTFMKSLGAGGDSMSKRL